MPGTRRFVAVVAVLLSMGCGARLRPTEPLAPELAREGTLRESAGIALVKIDHERHALVVDEDDSAIVEVMLGRDDGPVKKVVGTTRLPSRPHDLLVLADGRVAVTLPDAAAVALLARQPDGTLRETDRLATPAEPLSMALSPDDGTLWVTGGASHTLTAFNVATKTERARRDIGREPRGVLVTERGDRVIVAHAAESFVSVVPVLGGDVTTQELGAGRCPTGDDDGCPKRRFARNAQRIVRAASGTALVPMAHSLPAPPTAMRKQVRFAKGAGMFEGPRGGGYGGDGSFGPAVAPVMATVGPDGDAWFDFEITAGCKAPAGAAAWAGTHAERDVLVACPGSDRIFRYGSTKEVGAKLSSADVLPSVDPTGRGAELVPVKAIDVARGPSALATTENGASAFVWSSFERVVSLLDIAAEEPSVIASIELPRNVPRAAAWLRGREIFASESMHEISSDGRACTSCHVDGRDDGLVWRTPSGMRHTRLLAGQLRAGPFGWSGDAPTFEAHVRGTIQNLRGTGLGDAEMDALKTYATAMPAPPPAVATTHDLARGKALYASAECASCHDGERAVHDVGTGATLLTPTLAGVGRRRRLMHDGRFASLDELVASSTQMGSGSKLSAPDRRALVRYLETL